MLSFAARCVDLYLEQRNQAATGTNMDIDSRLAAIVERMFERCLLLVTLLLLGQMFWGA